MIRRNPDGCFTAALYRALRNLDYWGSLGCFRIHKPCPDRVLDTVHPLRADRTSLQFRGVRQMEETTEIQKTEQLPAEKPALAEIERVVTIFRELREGKTADNKSKLKSPSGTLSTAEAISVVNNGLAMAGYFGDGVIRASDLVSGIYGAVVKDPVQDKVVWEEYLETVVKHRSDWNDIYRAARDLE